MRTKNEIKELLSSPSDHKKPIEEATELDNKRRWFEQFIKEAEGRNKTSNPVSNSSLNDPIKTSKFSREDQAAQSPFRASRIPQLDKSTNMSDSSSNISLRSASSSSSLSSTIPSRIPTPILTRRNSSLLFNKDQLEKIIKIYKLNKDKRWVLISPDHIFVSQCRPKTTPALTYREHDKIRVEHLSNKEIEILELMQLEDNSEKNNKEIRFLGRK